MEENQFLLLFLLIGSLCNFVVSADSGLLNIGTFDPAHQTRDGGPEYSLHKNKKVYANVLNLTLT
jgi:hypothetical protein